MRVGRNSGDILPLRIQHSIEEWVVWQRRSKVALSVKFRWTIFVIKMEHAGSIDVIKFQVDIGQEARALRIRPRKEWLQVQTTRPFLARFRENMMNNSLKITTRSSFHTGMAEEDFDFSLETLKYVFLTARNVLLWAPALVLAVVLRVITHKWEHQLIFPMCELCLPA